MIRSLKIILGGLSLFFLAGISPILAQRGVDYRTLASNNQQQNIFIDYFTLPGENDSDNKMKFVASFRIGYSFLPFRKLRKPDNPNEFFSHVGLGIEVFKAEKKIENPDQEVPIEGLESVTRASWKDSAFAKTYEHTQSGNHFIEGYMQVELEPALYNYFLQLNRGFESSEQASRAQQVGLPPYHRKNNGTVILGQEVVKNNSNTSIRLLNYGNNARYGKDFYAFIQLIGHKSGQNYTISLNRVISTEDTTLTEKVFGRDIEKEEIYEDVKPVMGDNKSNPSIVLREKENGFAYALVKIPNSNFPNAAYQLNLTRKGQKKPVAQSQLRSIWPEIPISLLNLEVAIDMTKFIINEETLRNLQSGSREQREKKFREFWKEKDPTPQTEYNELMTEYYNRIDYAYANFTTVNTLGFNSDRGKIYIKYGDPDNIERKFPPGEPTVEIWTYGKRKFIFKATSGFGDFQLVSK